MLPVYEYNGDIYYALTDIKNDYDKLFKGCKYVTDILKKNILDPDFYIHLLGKPDKLHPPKPKQTRAPIYVQKDWADENLIDQKFISNVVKPLPSRIELKKSEILKQDNDENYDFIVRGDRSYHGIFFSVNRVQKFLNYADLNGELSKKKYIYNVHYIRFLTNSNKKVTYLTYFGFFLFLMRSKSPNAIKFQTWASKLAHTFHVGGATDKVSYVKNILKPDFDTMRSILDIDVSHVSCVYLFIIDKIKDLQYSVISPVDLPHNNIVLKFGSTNNLSRRLSEHERDYQKYTNKKLLVKCFAHVHPDDLNAAEDLIRTLLNAYIIKLDNHHEIISVDSTTLQTVVVKVFSTIDSLYGRRTDAFYRKQENEMKATITKLNHSIELKDSIHSAAINELTLKYELAHSNHAFSLLQKDNKISQLENKISSLEKKIAELERKNSSYDDNYPRSKSKRTTKKK